MRKNVAGQVISAHLVSSTDGSDVTSGTTTVYVTGDGGTQGSGGTATHEGNGCWTFLPSQANTNYAHVVFTFVNSSAISVDIQVYPVAYDPGDADDLGLTALTGHTPQTGDSYARLGAPAGASVSADIAAIKTDTGNIETDTQNLQSRVPAALVGGRMDSDAVAISGSTAAADSVEANIGNLDAAISSLNDPTAAAIADAVWDEAATGHTDAGKAGQQLWTDVDAILADTGTDGVVVAAASKTGYSLAADQSAVTIGTVNALAASGIDALFTRQLTESYAADGSAPTVAQALMMIQQILGDFSIAGTTLTVKKVDGSTTAATYTLNDGTNPTALTRAT